jgi:hypothetical protein
VSDNWQSFDPTAGDEGKALRALQRERFIRARHRNFEQGCTTYLLRALGMSTYTQAVRDFNNRASGESYLSVAAVNQVLPSLPVWFCARRVSRLNALRFDDLFNSPTRLPHVVAFHEARAQAPEVWRNRVILLLGPLTGLRRRSRKLLVGYSRSSEPTRSRQLVMADHVVRLAREELVFQAAGDFLTALAEEYSP